MYGRPVAAAGPETIYTVAGGPGQGLATNVFQEPQGIAASAGRAVYVADGYVVRRLDTNSSWEGVTAAGNLVIADTDAHRVRVVAARSGRLCRGWRPGDPG